MSTERRAVDDHCEDHTPAYLAIGTTVMVALMGFALFYMEVPHNNVQLIIQYVTGVLGVWGIAMGFYYNTNKNAAKAQDTMNKQAETARQAGVVLAAVTAPPGPTVSLDPGETATINAKEEPGTRSP